MKEYLLKKRPRIAIYLTCILFISTILLFALPQIGSLIALHPSNLKEALNWYRFLTYPLIVGGLGPWILNSLALIGYGYIIENRLKRKEIIILIMSSIIIGGVFYTIFNQRDIYNIPMASPTMISWAYWASAMVIAIRFWNSLNVFEKIIFVLGVISITSIYNENRGFLYAQLLVILFSLFFNIFMVNKNRA